MLIHLTPDAPAYIRGGYDPDTQTTVEIDLATLTEQQRTLLARYSLAQGSRRILRHERTGHDISVTAPTTAAVLDAVQQCHEAEQQRRAQHEAEQAARLEALLERARQVIRDRTETTHTRSLSQRGRGGEILDDRIYAEGVLTLDYQVPVPEWPSDYLYDVRRELLPDLSESEEAREWLRDIAVRAEAARAACVARLEEVWAERDAAKAERERRRILLRSWAAEHGGERLRLLAEEQMWAAHDTLAVAAYLTAHTPEGWQSLEGVTHVEKGRTKPTAADILALREARALVADQPEILTDPRLVWLVLYRPADPNDEEELAVADRDGDVIDDKFAAVLVTVTAPTGETREVYRRIG